MRRAFACLLFALLAVPATASAQDVLPPLAYAGPTASISRGAPLRFVVRTPAPDGSVVIRVSGSSETDADGLLSGGDGTWVDEDAAPAGPGLQVWSAPAGSVLRQRPGHYFWQAYLRGDAAAGAQEPVGPVRELRVMLPAANRGRGKLFPRFGRRGRTAFYLSAENFPATVSGARFRTLARTAAARWGLRALHWTSLEAGVRDGFNVAGFSPDVPKGVLGLETDYTRRGKVVERDLALRADENWAQGPDYPGLDQIDLQSVLLHELGHMAGNRRHKPRCANSPMIEALGAGEWWRGARDRWYEGCRAQASIATASGALMHRVVRAD